MPQDRTVNDIYAIIHAPPLELDRYTAMHLTGPVSEAAASDCPSSARTDSHWDLPASLASATLCPAQAVTIWVKEHGIVLHQTKLAHNTIP